MRIYHAGDLFDFKHLSGNRLLSDAVQKVSHGFYQTILPQDTEGNRLRNTSIRNGDLELVMSCHLALFNFDGTDLDSGTVVEFMITKMLDIPCVLLRTDFRNAGDQTVSSDPWNLMCSDYPRSLTVRIHAMNLYHQYVSGPDGLSAYLARSPHRSFPDLIVFAPCLPCFKAIWQKRKKSIPGLPRPVEMNWAR